MNKIPRKEIIHSLEKSIKIWVWLSENPTSHKHHAYKALGLAPDLNHCPLCELVGNYSEDETDLDCHLCPVWGEESQVYGCRYTCERGDSPYIDYMYWNLKAGALGMVQLLTDTLIKQTVEQENQP